MNEYREYFAQFLTKKLTPEENEFADKFLAALKEVSKEIDAMRPRLEREEREALINAATSFFTH